MQRPTGDLRIALIGAGQMGDDHARRIAHRCGGARLAVVSDVDLGRARAAAGVADGCRVEADPIGAIQADDIDAALIVTPGPTHEDLLFACIERQLPVLCEKPLTPDAKSSLRIVEAEVALGRRLIQVGFMRRYDLEYVALRDTIASGRLGRPVMMHCVHRAPSVPKRFTEGMQVSDSLVHEFDVTRWLLGQEITAVSVLRAGDAPAPDAAPKPFIMAFETSGGVLVDVEIFVNCAFGYQVRCEAVCESGTATIGANSGPVIQHEAHWGGNVTQDFQTRFARAYDLELQEWIRSVRDGDAGGPSAWDGYAAAAAAEAGLEAQRTGRKTVLGLTELPALYT